MLIGLRSLFPPGVSASSSSARALQRLFSDPDATARLRRAWPDLGFVGHLGQHQTDRDLRNQLDRAVHARRLALLWLPEPPHIDYRANAEYLKARTPAPVPALPGAKPSGAPAPTVKPPAPGVQIARQPAPIAGSPLPETAGHSVAQPARRPASVLSPVERIEAALSGSLNHVGPELKRQLSALTVAGVVNDIAIFCLALAIAQAAGVGAAAIDSALLAYAWYIAGWTGLQAIFQLVTASVTAMKASNDRELDDASRQYAHAFILLGETLLAAVLARIQVQQTNAARGATRLEEASVSSSEEVTSTQTAAGARIRANAARGAASEARVLNDLGLEKNFKSVYTVEGRAVPDALTDSVLVEIKDASYVSLSPQLRIETEAARATGRTSVLVTGANTTVSGPASRAFDQIIRRTDLGPQ